jgi:hypothetical protein
LISAERPQQLTRFAAWLLGLLFLWHLIVLATYAVNVPYWDEWDTSVGGSDLPPAALWRWMVAWSNEHRPVFTRLEIFLAAKWGGDNFIALQLFHFAIYGGLLLFIVHTAKKTAPRMPRWAPYAFCSLLLCTNPWEAHSWAIAGCWTLSILLFVSAAACLLDDEQRMGWLLAGATFMVLSFFSNSTGLLTGLVLAAWFSLFKLTRALGKPKGAHSRPRELAGLALVLTIFAVAFFFWSRGFQKPGGHPALALPDTAAFWSVFTNLVSFGFGFQQQSVFLGVVCLLLVLCPVALSFWTWRASPPPSVWRSSGVLLAVLGAVAGITMARAGFGPDSAKSPRYSVLAMILVPFTAVSWSIALDRLPRLKGVVVAGLFAFCLFGFKDDWSVAPYRNVARARRQGVECLRRSYVRGGEANCPMLHPTPVTEKLAYAARHHLSFYEQIRETAVQEDGFHSASALLASYELTPALRGTSGFIDLAQLTCGGPAKDCKTAITRGWALDPFAKVPALKVWIVQDGEVLAVSTTGIDRPDVAKALGIPEAEDCGWDVTVDATRSAVRLEPGRFVAYALLSDEHRIVELKPF